MMRPALTLTGTSAAAAKRWTPARLLNGQIGFWAGGFAPGADRLWQDSAASLPALLPEDEIARIDPAAGSHSPLQPTAALRPKLARWPKGGRRNFALHSEDVRQWMPASVLTPNATDIIEATANLEHRADQRNIHTFEAGKTYTVSVDATVIGERVFRLSYSSGAFASNGRGAVFDLVGGTILSKDTPVTASISAAPDADGYWRCNVTATAVSTAVGHAFCCICLWTGSSATLTYLGDGVSGIRVRRIQIEEASTPGAYQKVGTALDVTQTGVPPVWYLQGDGSDTLPLLLPAGTYGRASVTALGQVTVTSVTSDGTTALNALPVPQEADVIFRSGAFLPAEVTRLTEFWQAAYLA